jgi:hypothetical protein
MRRLIVISYWTATLGILAYGIVTVLNDPEYRRIFSIFR